MEILLKWLRQTFIVAFVFCVLFLFGFAIYEFAVNHGFLVPSQPQG